MYAIRFYQYGDADQLVYEEVPVPEPQAGEIRFKVTRAGLNFTEIYQRRGWYPATRPFPIGLGAEFAGVVDALGEGVTDFKVGDRVATGDGRDAYAEYAIAPAAKVVAIPPAITDDQAAALILQGVTAQYLAYSTYPLRSGETVLIHAAAGGVGLLLVQMAKKIGAEVIATVSTEEKADLARAAGADHVILYSSADFETETKRITNNQGVAVVYDSVGKTTFLKSLECLQIRGMLILYGQSSGPADVIDPRILNKKSLYLTRPSRNAYTVTRAEMLERVNKLFDWVAHGELNLRIDRTFPMRETIAATRYMEDRGTKGKVLLIP